MPELPEVENIIRQIRLDLADSTILEARVLRPSVIRNTEGPFFERVFCNNRITVCRRRGKYMLFELASNHMLVVHLGMTGQLLVVPAEEERVKHTHIIWRLDSHRELRFSDARRFGGVHLLDHCDETIIPGLGAMGPEPLAAAFTFELWNQMLDRRKGGFVKRWLLDQRFIAGLGNIYADESLYEAGIDPRRDITTLTPPQRKRLYDAIRSVLTRAIKEGGSSIRDYINARGQKGGFQESHCVYGKGGEPCPACGETLQSCRISGRTTTYCRRCQK